MAFRVHKCGSTQSKQLSARTRQQLQQPRPTRQCGQHLAVDQRRQLGRLQALPAEVAQVADLQMVAEGLGVLGIAAGGVFGSVWNLEKQSVARLQQELQEVQQQVQQTQQQLAQAEQQVQQERKARKEAEEWKPRLDSAQEELFKLEKALEIKDGQLAVFMNTAHRQIKGLEDTVKELQKM